MNNKIILTMVIVVSVGFIVYVFLADRGTVPKPAETPAQRIRIPDYSEKDVVTFAEYQNVRTGMTYQRTVEIIGFSGTEMSRNYLEGVSGVMESTTTIMYSWVNDNGSNMNAIFQNNKLVQKAQFGL